MSGQGIDCREALRLLAAYLDGELEDERRFDLDGHLEVCRSCYSRAEFERRLRAQLAALRSTQVEPAFEARIRDLIGRFAAAAERDARGD
jgi:anti-sigma factor (TIGR02949 family)